jgi:DNA-binding MarR family transcriptional regulator
MTRAASEVDATPPAGGTRAESRNPIDAEHARRIGRAWIELRRGASAAALRNYLFGDETPLEQGQLDALDLLARRDRAMKELAGRLRVDPSTATRAVQRLEADGLVERFASPDDGRVVLVRITDGGRRRREAPAARRAVAMYRILAAFERHERAALADLLDRFIESLDEVVGQLAEEERIATAAEAANSSETP